jgi:stage V sporulation protein G
MLRISEINIALVKPKDGLIGFASLVVNDAVFLGGIGIYQKLNGGHRLTYPTRKAGAQNFDIFHPISRDAAQAIETAIFLKLSDVMNMQAGNAGHNSLDAT